MRLYLVTAGSRGDVEPFVALAREATRRGHEVVLALPDNSSVATHELDVRSLRADFAALIAGQGVSPLKAIRELDSVVRPTMRAVIVEAARLGLEARPDVVVAHPKVLSAPLVAGATGARFVVAEIVPSLTPTRRFPAAGTVPFSLGPFNPVTYRAAAAAAGMFRRELQEAADLLGRPEPAVAAASLVPASARLLPRPDDWPESTRLTGPWWPQQSDAVSEEVDAFLEAGADVAVIGFGSMAQGDALERGAALVSAARANGLRSLVLRGWGGVEVPPEVLGPDVLVVDSAPHAAVLPRAAVFVHHGGAGTSHAAVRAGVPSVVVPFIADQPFWARQLADRGFAAPALSRRRLSAARATEAIGVALARRDRVAAVAALVAAENGAAVAVDELESIAAR